ncbi:MaoC family dehydratase [Corynebacterium lubricantis]|uniref:MaoC family dehydratase n=1 Tax=Corynebacterium lubricantis TaxID=541095 RepID=UPI00037EF13A|nr:MaoC/PaaZ C-terminal domain-containing protein [Corynebacterium lubricantis]
MAQYTQLSSIPELMVIYRSAMKDMVPVIGTTHTAKSDPTTAFEVSGVEVDEKHLASYCQATGLRLGNELPATYPYVLTFPLVMKLLTAKEFPFKAIGAVHISNSITQLRPLTLNDVFDVRVHAQNLRPHRRGLIIDFITEVSVAGEVVWSQTSTFLGGGAKLAKDAESSLRERAEDTGQTLDRPDVPARASNALLRVSAEDISNYADASGDKNPIHVSKLGAKAFGFPSTIAHGMYTAAVMLGSLEGRLPQSFTYTVDFAKPVILPAKVALWTEHTDGGWELQARKASKPETLHAVGLVGPTGA